MSSTRPGRKHKVALVWAAVAVACGAAILLARTVRIAVVHGHSMAPSLKEGDYLVTETVSPRLGNIERFDLIVFNCPALGGREVVKRVIALPGETVKISVGRVYVDGKELEQPFLRSGGYAHWGPGVVPEGSYFVLGDNRVSSVDSTAWGPIPARLVTGVVRAKISQGGGE